MAYTIIDGDGDDTDLTPEWFRKIEEHLNGKVTPGDTHPLNEDTKKQGHIKKQRNPSEVKIDELQLEIQRIQSDADTLRAYNRNLEQDNAKNEFAVSEIARLRAQVAALTDASFKADAEELLFKRSAADASNAAEKATHEAAQARIQMQSFQNSNGRLIIESSTLRCKLEEARTESRTRSSEAARSGALVNELQEKLNTEQRESNELADKNHQLVVNQNASEEEVRNCKQIIQFLKNKIENVEHELQEARVSAAAAVTAHDSFLAARPSMQRVYSTPNASPLPSLARLEREIEKNKAEKQELEERLQGIKSNDAILVTHLDLAKKDMCIYNCQHDDLRNICDDQNSTCENVDPKTVHEMFMGWSDDEDFLKQYMEWRHHLLRHHRAHERTNDGRGVASWKLKKDFTNMDEKRGAEITYK